MIVALSIVVALSSATPTADTTSYVVLNHGRPAGEMLVIRDRRTVRVLYHHVDRNRGVRSEAEYHLDTRGVVIGAESRQLPLGHADDGADAADDWFAVAHDSVTWRAFGMRAAARLEPNLHYRLASGTIYEQARLAAFLLRQPDGKGRLLPAGAARADVVADTNVGGHRLRLVSLREQASSAVPEAVWIDEAGSAFASAVGWFITVRRGGEHVLPTLRALESRWRDASAEALASRVAPTPAPAVVIVGADLFDSESGDIRPGRTIVVHGSRITAVGAAGTVAIPAGATIVDAAGMTVMPGLWDMHTHMQLASQVGAATYQLAAGITTIRDLASDVDVAVSYRDRADAGIVAGPRAVLAGFIDGPGAWAGPTDAIVRDSIEARHWVAQYDSLGYSQVKLYNLVTPDLVPVIAREARARGMRVSGHIPRGLTLPDAVRLGFDEINHGAFLFSTFHQDSLYHPAARSYAAVAVRVAPWTDVDGQAMTELITLLRDRAVVIDGTFQLWLWSQSMDVSGDSLAQRSDRNYLRLILRLHEAGVTLVPGTDGGSYVGELELYEQAGIPAVEVLRMATLIPARVMHDERDYGSIAVGKVADLIIVDGKPYDRVSDLRRVRHVMRAGRLYDSGALRAAVGQ